MSKNKQEMERTAGTGYSNLSSSSATSGKIVGIPLEIKQQGIFWFDTRDMKISAVSSTDDYYREIKQRILVLEEKIDDALDKLEVILDEVASEFVEVPQEELEEIILERATKNESFLPDELAEELGVDPFLVIDICEKLVVEGKLKGQRSGESITKNE